MDFKLVSQTQIKKTVNLGFKTNKTKYQRLLKWQSYCRLTAQIVSKISEITLFADWLVLKKYSVL